MRGQRSKALELRHCGFHRDTLFEEYCAYAVEVQVSGASLPKFGIYDPLVSQYVKRFGQDSVSVATLPGQASGSEGQGYR